jgi:hypothetical protein
MHFASSGTWTLFYLSHRRLFTPAKSLSVHLAYLPSSSVHFAQLAHLVRLKAPLEHLNRMILSRLSVENIIFDTDQPLLSRVVHALTRGQQSEGYQSYIWN